MKVGHGTMTPGYESWWRVGVAEVAKDPKVVECWKDMQKHISEARDY
jgi:3D-(3,5/4)-trihydroxycyclohexane-1,2-dione acylhydrolase (decyclizing)